MIMKLLKSKTISLDYVFLRDAIKHPDNKKRHVPALKRLLENFERKWSGLYDPRSIDFLKLRLKHI